MIPVLLVQRVTILQSDVMLQGTQLHVLQLYRFRVALRGFITVCSLRQTR
jgi:hypothetical protein